MYNKMFKAIALLAIILFVSVQQVNGSVLRVSFIKFSSESSSKRGLRQQSVTISSSPNSNSATPSTTSPLNILPKIMNQKLHLERIFNQDNEEKVSEVFKRYQIILMQWNHDFQALFKTLSLLDSLYANRGPTSTTHSSTTSAFDKSKMAMICKSAFEESNVRLSQVDQQKTDYESMKIKARETEIQRKSLITKLKTNKLSSSPSSSPSSSNQDKLNILFKILSFAAESMAYRQRELVKFVETQNSEVLKTVGKRYMGVFNLVNKLENYKITCENLDLWIKDFVLYEPAVKKEIERNVSRHTESSFVQSVLSE